MGHHTSHRGLRRGRDWGHMPVSQTRYWKYRALKSPALGCSGMETKQEQNPALPLPPRQPVPACLLHCPELPLPLTPV